MKTRQELWNTLEGSCTHMDGGISSRAAEVGMVID
jgi:hypothetical protein